MMKMMKTRNTLPAIRRLLFLSLLISLASAFVPNLPRTAPSPLVVLSAAAAEESNLNSNINDGDGGSRPFSSSITSRRHVLGQATTALTLSWLLFPLDAAAAAGMGATADSPIVVLGAGGKVGKKCTQLLTDKGLYCRAVTRSGRQVLDSPSDFVSYAAADVIKYETVQTALKDASGCIFAASASGKKKGGDPAHVDYLGVFNTAKACLECSVPKLVVISAGTVTRPDSIGFKATNFAVKFVYGDKIMDYKMAGEAVMRTLYKSAAKPGLAYTVIRPGGLNDRPSIGASKVHVSQGDVYSSEISREDVAEVTVAALLKGKATDFTTFELNQVEGLGKAMGSLPDSPAELVHAGAATFDGLLEGLLTDDQMTEKYGSLINDFRGDGVESVEQLA